MKNKNTYMYTCNYSSIYTSSIDQIQMDKNLYPNHPVRCIITGPSESGKSVFLTNLILNIINEYEKYTSIHLVFIKIVIKN